MQMEMQTKADNVLSVFAFEKSLRTQTNSQPQVLIKVGEKVRPIKLNFKRGVDYYLKTGKCILSTQEKHLQRENFIPKKFFRFPANYELRERPPPTPARK